MKFFSKIDLISPKITLYYKGELLHPSIFSGLLSLICCTFVVLAGIYYLREVFLKKNPTAFFFNRFVQDAGIFPLNSSSMFNYVQISKNDEAVMIDFDSVRFIGLDRSIEMYILNPNLTDYDHWIYGKCNNDTDIGGIRNIHNFNFTEYSKSACIRKYYNKTTGKYYETNDINFRWPSLDRGCANKGATYYGIVVEKCKNDSLRINFEKKLCKSDSEINEYMSYAQIKLLFVDHYADVYNYKEPFRKYIYDLGNGIYDESFYTNNINLNPSSVKTHHGMILDKIDEKNAYSYYKTERVTSSTGDTGIYTAFYFWMQNTMQHYERKYQSLLDALSNVGGMTRIILIISNVINYIVSRYVILVDSDELFFALNEKNKKEGLNFEERQIKKDIDNFDSQKNIHLSNNNNSTTKNKVLSENNCMSKENINCSKSSKEGIPKYGNRDNFGMIENLNQNKCLIYNRRNCFYKNNYSYYGKKVRNNRNETEQMSLPIRNNLKNDIDNNDKYIKESGYINYIGDKYNKIKFNFCQFLSYIICCGRNNEKINYVEKLRYKILSEETIVQYYLILKEMNKLSEFVK